MKHTPKKLGLFSAMGLVGYIGLFVSTAYTYVQWMESRNFSPHPLFGIPLFLLAFCTSALVCGSIVFFNPLRLFLDGESKAALHTILWTIVWLLVCIVVMLLGSIVFFLLT